MQPVAEPLPAYTPITELIDYFLVSPLGEPIRLLASFPGSRHVVRVRAFESVAEGLAYVSLSGLAFAHSHRELKF